MEPKPVPPKKSEADARRSHGPVTCDVPAAKPKPYRRDYRSLGCAATLIIAAAIPLALFGLAAWALHDLSKPIGVVGPDQWPIALADNYQEWQSRGADIDAIEVFRTREDMVGGTAILKVRDKPATWEYFKAWSSNDVMETSQDARERWEEVADRYPGWAPDLDDPNVEILPRKGMWDATMLRVVRDPANETIYIDYYFDF